MQEISNLINQMFEGAKSSDAAFLRNLKLIREIEHHGPKIIDPVLQKLFEKKERGEIPATSRCALGFPLFFLINAVARFAGPEHTQPLAKILTWDEVVLNPDYPTQDEILRILRFKGDASIIPFLKECAEKIKKVEWPHPYKGKECQEEVAATIKLCQQRGASP